MLQLGFNIEYVWVIIFFPFFLASLLERSSKEPIEVREGKGEVIWRREEGAILGKLVNYFVTWYPHMCRDSGKCNLFIS